MASQQQPAQRACRDCAEAARRALIDTSLLAHEEAGLSGLCAEGRWEAAVDAMRSLDLTAIDRRLVDDPGTSALTPTASLIAGLTRAVDAVSRGPAPPPGGGSIAASVGALAAALTQMVAGLTRGRPKYAAVADEMSDIAQRADGLAAELTLLVEQDAIVFDALGAAYQQPRTSADAGAARAESIRRALMRAAEVPLDIARAAASVAELAVSLAERGNTNAVADAAVAALIAESVCRASALTVRVNVAGCADEPRAAALAQTAAGFADAATRAAARAVAAAEQPC